MPEVSENQDAEVRATEDGLEGERDEGSSVDPEFKPFDPNKIRVRQEQMPVYNICEHLREGEIDLAPEFQRRAGLWSEAAKSRLIESLLIRIPLPALYLEELKRDSYAAVDGVQRLTVLKRFMVDRNLHLRGLEFLTDLEGMNYDSLPSTLQRRLNGTNLTVYIIEPGTPSTAKLNIFKRINTGGVSLTAQEIRHAMNPGEVRTMLLRLAESEAFLRATRRGVRSNRMADRELIARFFAFRGDGRRQYSRSRDLDGFINEAMANLNTISNTERAALEARFQRAMHAASDTLGEWAFRRPANDGRRGPVNKALFEAYAVAMDDLTDDALVRLRAQSDFLKSEYQNLFRTSPDFLQAVTVGTGDAGRVSRRFDAMRDLVIRVAS